jgi:hypothetical protein
MNHSWPAWPATLKHEKGLDGGCGKRKSGNRRGKRVDLRNGAGAIPAEDTGIAAGKRLNTRAQQLFIATLIANRKLDFALSACIGG